MESPGQIPVPCGLCRQKMQEFSISGDIPIIAMNALKHKKEIYKFTLKELLPCPFGRHNLRKGD
jgi:cytidine deaminase